MQKTKKNASILIWSIFLSLIISIGFISISTKIHKSVQENINFQDTIKDQLSSRWWAIEKNETIMYSDKNTETLSLKKSENKNIAFSGSSQEYIEISIINWGPIEMVYNNNSEIIYENFSFSWNTNDVEITLNNLSWYSLLNISSSAEIKKDLEKSITWREIWNKKIVKKYSH